jgi:multiple sugar transport system permease protein
MTTDQTAPARIAKRARRRRGAGTYLYLLPAALLLLAVFGVPLVWSVVMSLQQSAGILGTRGWAGLDNYATVLTRPVFWSVAGQTLVWTLGVLAVTTVLSIVLALLLHRPFRGRTLIRVLLMLPWASALAISAVVWSFGLRDAGVINHTLRSLGLDWLVRDWLAVPPDSTVVLILIGAWASIPFTVMMLSAAVKSIPDEIFEAVSLETSNPFQRDWYFTIPLMKRMIQITVMSNAIVVFNSFPLIAVLTGGGPANKTDILATYLYKLAFKSQEFGEASAIAVLVSIALVIPTVFYARQIIGAAPKRSRARSAR